MGNPDFNAIATMFAVGDAHDREYDKLKKRATPMKVVNRHYGWFQEPNIGRMKMAYCPACNTEHHEDNQFCHSCGQALDWSEQ